MPAFSGLARAFLTEECADSPVLASHLGVDGYDDRLDDLSETALDAEQMMREQGFFEDPRQAMSQAEAMLFRAARIVADTSLHMGDMSVDEAVAFMRTKANLPELTARAEVAQGSPRRA